MTERIIAHSHLAVAHVVGARPSLATDGVSCAAWKGARFAVRFTGTTLATVGGPAGVGTSPELWVYEAGQWWMSSALVRPDGAALPIASATQGYVAVLDNYRSSFERLCVAGSPSAGTVTARLTPLEVQS